MRKKIFYSAYIIGALMLLTLMIWQLILNYSKYHAVYLDYAYPLSIKYPIGYVVLIGMYWITTITVMFFLTLISIRKLNPDTKKRSLIIKSAIGISVFNISLGIYDIVSVISYVVAQFDASIFTMNTEGNRLFVMTTGGSVVWIAISVLPIIYVNLLKKNTFIKQIITNIILIVSILFIFSLPFISLEQPSFFILQISSFLISINRLLECKQKYSVEEAANDYMVFDVILMEFENLANYSLRLSEETIRLYPEIAINELRAIRNRIAHDYLSVQIKTLYDTMDEDFPELKRKLEELIK